MSDKKIFLCTAGDENYFNNLGFQKCLTSYSKNTTFLPRVFLVEDNDMHVDTCGVKKILCPWKSIVAKNSNRCVQHGEFANFFDEARDDDIIIFTDGDIVQQRLPTDQEIEQISNIRSGVFMANYNIHKHSKLSRLLQDTNYANPEELKIFCSTSFDVTYEDTYNYKEMNTGVLIGHKHDFLKLSKIYSSAYEQLRSIIPGFWNQQFLINLIVNKFFQYEDLRYQFHTHTHHSLRTSDGGAVYNQETKQGVPEPVINTDHGYTIHNEVILFAHKF